MFSNNNQNFGMNEDNEFFVQKNEYGFYPQEKRPNLFENDPFAVKNEEKSLLPNIFDNGSPIRLREDFFDLEVSSNLGFEPCFVCKGRECNCLKGTEEEHFEEPRFNFNPPPIIKEKKEVPQIIPTIPQEDTTKCEIKETEDEKEKEQEKEVITIEEKPKKEKSKGKSKYDSNLFLVRRA